MHMSDMSNYHGATNTPAMLTHWHNFPKLYSHVDIIIIIIIINVMHTHTCIHTVRQWNKFQASSKRCNYSCIMGKRYTIGVRNLYKDFEFPEPRKYYYSKTVQINKR